MTLLKARLETIEVEGKPLGRSLVEHDPKSRDYPLATVLDRLPTLKGPREWWRRDRFDQNQGGPWNGHQPESSCTFQAIAGLLVTSPARKDRHVHARLRDLLDPGFRWKGYRTAQDLDPWAGDEETDPRYQGSSTLAAAKAAKALDLVPQDWEYRWVFHGTAEVIEALAKTPVAVGTLWKTGMDDPDRKGVIRYTGKTRGGHAWEITDYDERTDLFDAWNSWGLWGPLRGRMRIPRPDLEAALAEDGEALAFVSPVLAAA